jgi:hypothetical protein
VNGYDALIQDIFFGGEDGRKRKRMMMMVMVMITITM